MLAQDLGLLCTYSTTEEGTRKKSVFVAVHKKISGFIIKSDHGVIISGGGWLSRGFLKLTVRLKLNRRRGNCGERRGPLNAVTVAF